MNDFLKTVFDSCQIMKRVHAIEHTVTSISRYSFDSQSSKMETCYMLRGNFPINILPLLFLFGITLFQRFPAKRILSIYGDGTSHIRHRYWLITMIIHSKHLKLHYSGQIRHPLIHLQCIRNVLNEIHQFFLVIVAIWSQVCRYYRHQHYELSPKPADRL